MPAKKLTKAQVNAEARAIVKALMDVKFMNAFWEPTKYISPLLRRARRLRPYLKEA